MTAPRAAVAADVTLHPAYPRSLRSGYRVLGWLAAIFPPVLAGYALLDRGFAWLRIPGISFFAGELLVTVSLIVALVGTVIVRRGLQGSPVAKLLLIFAAWGLIGTLPNIGHDGINAVRDAALWYYPLLAIPLAGLVLARPEVVWHWATLYRRFIPWMLAWSLVAVILNKASLGGRLGPIVPGSPAIPLWSHKVGNLAVHAVTALAFLWLVPSLAGRYRQLIIGLGIVVLLVVATQNRGGLVAALAALAVLFLLSSRRAGLIAALVTTVAAVLVLGWSLNVHVKGEHDRTVSVSQLTENVGSLTGHSQADKNLQATAAWRNELWTSVIHKIRDEHKVVTGLGFGPDIAKELGFQGQATETLRSPHNSHLDVFARMGILGAALWVGLWATWYGVAWRGRSRLHALGRHIEAGLVEVSLVGVTAILVNAYFDPTLESPQVAIWLWTLVGLSLGIIRAGRLAATARSSTVR